MKIPHCHCQCVAEVSQVCAVDLCNSGLCDGGPVNVGIGGGESCRMSEKHRPNGSSNQVGRYSYLCVAAESNIYTVYII